MKKNTQSKQKLAVREDRQTNRQTKIMRCGMQQEVARRLTWWLNDCIANWLRVLLTCFCC